MYSKNYNDRRNGYANTPFEKETERNRTTGPLPLNYGGVAAYSGGEKKGTYTERDESSGRDPRFPLMYEGSQNDGYERALEDSAGDGQKAQKREGLMGSLASRSINGEDLLLAALLLLLLNSGADDDILLLLGLLLILGI